jgi:cell division transport system permease protein
MKHSKSKPSSLSFLLILSISILGFFVCLFSQFVIGLKHFSLDVKSQMKIYVYMEDSLNTDDLLATKSILKSKKFVDLNSNNLQLGVEFVSKNKIAEDFLKSSHENYQELLGDENPFKNMFILNIADSYKNTQSFNKISKDLSKINGVYEVTYPNKQLNFLISKIESFTFIILIISMIMLVFIYFQISNYIRIAIYSNRTLIKTMQLLGSTNAFIQKPYLIKSIQLGLIGSTIGFIITNALFYLLQINFPSLSVDLFNLENQILIWGITASSCLFFCLISTLISLSKYFNIQQSNIH